MIKAVIFDCFGVLTTDGWIAFKKRHFSNSKELAAEASELNQSAGSGAISYAEFLVKLSGISGIASEQIQHEINSNITDDELMDYIKTLKPRYKIGMLSNAAANHLKRLFTPEQIAIFDEIILSYEAGVIKPDERAYRLAAEKLGVQTRQCVFIDDQKKHITGAQAAGMHAIYYEDFPGFKKQLQELLSAGTDN